MTGQTMAAKIWDRHVIEHGEHGSDLLYIDLHLLHEVNTPAAFAALREKGRVVRRPDLTLGTEDHNTPTDTLNDDFQDPAGRQQSRLMRENCQEFGIPLHRFGTAGQGIVHVIAPEQGLVRPGMTIVCCDSHTTTLGAFGALAFGIGTKQVEHVLASQSLRLQRPADLAVTVVGELPVDVSAKDLAMAVVATLGPGGGQGSVIEFRGPVVRALSMEGRMTLCNMAVEAGSRAGLVSPDDTTVEYLSSRVQLPDEATLSDEAARWLAVASDPGAHFAQEVVINANTLTMSATWGTNPGQVAPISGRVPDPADLPTPALRSEAETALAYLDLRPGMLMRDIQLDAVFIGSCTNGRIEDLRAAAAVLNGRQVRKNVRALIVPGSAAVHRQAVAEGLDRVFAQAGADFRPAAGCSMCCGLNSDRLSPGERAASTSNRSFEGRQGRGSRTHIVSPAVAAASAITGRLTSPHDL
jgi:3-isopropylmalate/(R)-2-methylmalate dehydratase large subunit